MRDSGQDIWWRKSRQLALTLAGAIAVLGFGTAALSPLLDGRTFLGMSLSYALFAVAAPAALLGAIFWFARRQIALDYRYDVTGDEP